MSQLLLLYSLSALLNAVQFVQMSTFGYVCKDIHISDLHQGYVKTYFIGLQLIGTPLIGVLVSRLGLKLGLIIAFLSTAASCFFLAISQGLFLIVVSQSFGLLMVGHQAFQTAIAHLTKPGAERTSAFSKLGLSFGIGFVLTPIITKLSTLFFGQTGPLLVSAGICVLSLPLLFIVKDAKQEDDDAEGKNKKLKGSGIEIIMKDPTLRNLFLTKLLVTCPAYIIFGVLQLHMINKFALTQTQDSLMQLELGLSIMIANSVGQMFASRIFKEAQLIRQSAIVAVGCYVVFAYLEYFWIIWPLLFVLIQAMTFVNNASDSMITTRVKAEQQGLILGLANSAIAFVRAASPTLAVLIIEEFGFGYLGLIGVICSAIGVALSSDGFSDYQKIE
ncbi:unnamed protein product [Bursaphelenchus xylophilus]|uniref:(pine wood nematode) hypothetical protein n=1 Tax=Bursaphelenchus xylophilus TaxID=6326 RepID=A0A1I7RLE4_BURXY|nr:unnamed protein product [Bursaphelenchus xylophilus]CAG9083086.1 unnamed protein product [Bursaphelenchus xylophilus]